MIRVIPKPNYVVENKGVYTFNKCLVKNEFQKNNKFIQDLIDDYSIKEAEIENLVFIINNSLGKEEYTLTVDDKGVRIVASTEVGAFLWIANPKANAK